MNVALKAAPVPGLAGVILLAAQTLESALRFLYNGFREEQGVELGALDVGLGERLAGTAEAVMALVAGPFPIGCGVVGGLALAALEFAV
jgi:hypothetical protein